MDASELQESHRQTGPIASPPAGCEDDADNDLRDLRDAFLRATGADRCVVQLVHDWRQTVGGWLSQPPAARGEPTTGETVPVSWVTLGRDGAKGEARVDLLMGGAPAARIIVTTEDHRNLTQLASALETFIPKVSSHLCLRWLREEANAHERRRLAQDLHDGPLQLATAAKIRLQARRQFVADPRAMEAIDEAIDLTRQVIGSMRKLLASRVRSLRSDSLKTHLRRAVGRWSEMTGVRVHINFSDSASEDLVVFSPETLEAAEHVVGEGIVNAWKHGKATQLSISCHPHNGGVLLTLRDDGCGLQPSAAAPHPDGTKIGLRLLQSRINELGGWFDVRSPQSGGTIVETWLPSSQHRFGSGE